MMQPVPGHVVHLLGQPTGLPAGEQGTGGSYYRRNAHDKHHVKAPEDVNGKDSLIHCSKMSNINNRKSAKKIQIILIILLHTVQGHNL